MGRAQIRGRALAGFDSLRRYAPRVWSVTRPIAVPTPTPIRTLRIRWDFLRETTRTTSLRRNLCSPRRVRMVRLSVELETNSPFSARLLVTTSIGVDRKSLPRLSHVLETGAEKGE